MKIDHVVSTSFLGLCIRINREICQTQRYFSTGHDQLCETLFFHMNSKQHIMHKCTTSLCCDAKGVTVAVRNIISLFYLHFIVNY